MLLQKQYIEFLFQICRFSFEIIDIMMRSDFLFLANANTIIVCFFNVQNTTLQ